MAENKAVNRVGKKARRGNSRSTQAGKQGVQSARQGIEIERSQGRKAGVSISRSDRKVQGSESGAHQRASRVRARANLGALRRESHLATSPTFRTKHARQAPRKRAPKAAPLSALQAVKAKGKALWRKAAHKASKLAA